MAALWIGDIVREYRDYRKNEFPTLLEQWKKQTYPTDDAKLGDLYCEWDENGVRILVKGKENVALLANLNTAFQNNRAYVGLGGQGPFCNGGLTIIDTNDISAENKKVVLDADLDYIALKKAAADTGIEAKLEATQTTAWDWPEGGCKWYALSPKWNNFKNADGTPSHPSKYPVVFWLNPQTQSKVNAGWFTVEDLEQWIEGKGPVVKTSERKS
jgi:hypothetical protein